MSDSVQLVHGTWEDAEALIGTTIATLESPDVVTAADMRRKLEVLGVDSPLYTDADVARAHGYDDVVSPASMVRTWAMPSYWRPGTPRVGAQRLTPPIPATAVPGVGDTLIATGVRMDYHAPIYPGDRISGTATLLSVTRKDTRVGPGAFIVVQTTYRNQHGDAVTTETVTLLRYQRVDKDAG